MSVTAVETNVARLDSEVTKAKWPACEYVQPPMERSTLIFPVGKLDEVQLLETAVQIRATFGPAVPVVMFLEKRETR